MTIKVQTFHEISSFHNCLFKKNVNVIAFRKKLSCLESPWFTSFGRLRNQSAQHASIIEN